MLQIDFSFSLLSMSRYFFLSVIYCHLVWSSTIQNLFPKKEVFLSSKLLLIYKMILQSKSLRSSLGMRLLFTVYASSLMRTVAILFIAVQCNVVPLSTVQPRAIAQYIALLYCHKQNSFCSDLFPHPNPIARRLPKETNGTNKTKILGVLRGSSTDLRV